MLILDSPRCCDTAGSWDPCFRSERPDGTLEKAESDEQQAKEATTLLSCWA